MQREQVSIRKIILYLLFSLLIFVLQTSVFGSVSFFRYRFDLLPALAAAAALLGGPIEGAVVGTAVGVFYDIGLVGIDGMYPLFFLLFGMIAGSVSRLSLRRNYISMLILTAGGSVLLGLLRFFFQLSRAGATFLPVLRQIAGGTLLTCALCFIVYLPMRRISGKPADR